MEGVTGSDVSYETPTVSKELKTDSYGHKWVVSATFTLSRDEVLTNLAGEEKVHLDMESLADMSLIVCWQCELPFFLSSHHDCPGEPKGYDKMGRPIHHQRWVREAFAALDASKGE